MLVSEKIVIGTRGSSLALIQASIAQRALSSVTSDIQVDIRIIKTEGDRNQKPIPLDVVGKGWFTKEIESELIHRNIDIAVHSLKDMAESMPEGLHIGAYVERADARDVLVSKQNRALMELPPGAIIGTDSIRRKVQILTLRPDLIVASIRGNVETRLEKLIDGTYDAVVLAAAGLQRLGKEDQITQYFTTAEMMPAPGQGILVMQIRENEPLLEALMEKLNDVKVATEAKAERAFAKSIGASCKSPAGAYATLEDDSILLEGMITNEQDGTIFRDSIYGLRKEAEELGITLGKRMLAQKNAHGT